MQAAAQILPKLRPVDQHPDMSEFLTHFCVCDDRPQPQARDWIKAMSAPQRLNNILWEKMLRVFVTFSGGNPALCLTEATKEGLSYLVRERRHQPWGLVFDRQSVYDAGGGPVWYVRTDEFYQVRDAINSHCQAQVSSRCQARMVRLQPHTSDWLAEREWRIPVTGADPVIPLDRLRLRALLVGGLFWTRPTPAGNNLEYEPGIPEAAHGVPHWIWNGQTFVEWEFQA